MQYPLRLNWSQGSWAPFFAINGPIRDQIHINYSSGALSPGDIANAAIGRTVGLIVKNSGGARKAIEDMGVIGNPAKYTLVIGEDEEEAESGDILSQPPEALDTDTLLVIVAGGPGAWTGMLRSVGGINNSFVTKKIKLPGNWDELVKKYKDVVPTYAMY